MRHEDDDEEKEFDIMNVKIINVTISDNSSELIRKDAYIGGKQVKVLIDSGDDHNIIRPHLGQKLYRRRTVRAMRFDGSSTTKKSTNIFKYKIKMEGQVYKDVILTEWELLEQQDIILGKPWLVQYNPRIDWRTHTIELPTPLAPVESEEFEERVKQGNYTEVYSTSIKKNETERVPTPIHQVLDEFPQVIPDQLPDVLPPERDIEHVILLEQDAKPFTGAPFRLSKGARSSG
ncbi:retroelement pol polyprotein [Plasmopara halstedii]|uniref:Retroelement pol polyprotein n=1 Tax=Plasmopara halstedii TaxID=4781 RepID=A0A0P1AMF9_PLAHL|nr:retroelement pol polyprotein [Plasmopara halstedii]CEG42644.1 retroelement pol polyprotein [Plasmopara halstedii]|eukprot:XP_024579013.1 retroelement pol polyprotein [Plasmopara halstedii]